MNTNPYFCALVGAFDMAMFPPHAVAATVAGVEVPAPLSPVESAEQFWGQRVTDPWRHLENLADPAVQNWLRQQAEATEKILARLPGRAELLRRLHEIDTHVPGQVAGVVRCQDGSLFYLRRNPGEEQFVIVHRPSPDAHDEVVVVDPHLPQHGGGPAAAVMDFQPSPDGRRLAFSLQVAGAELGTLHVIDVDSGRALSEPRRGVRYPQVSWRSDSSGFFYTRLREGWQALEPAQRLLNQTRHYRDLHMPADAPAADRLVMSAALAPELSLAEHAHPGVFEIPGTPWAGVWVNHGVERFGSLALAPLADVLAGRAHWRLVADRADEVTDYSIGAETIYLLSTRGAPRGQVLRVPLAAPDLRRASVAVPQGEGVLVGMAASRDALYLTRRDGVRVGLYRLPHGADTLQAVKLPVEGRVGLRHAHPLQDGALLAVGGWTQATRSWAYEPGRCQTRQLRLEAEGRFDVLSGYVAHELTVPGHDGVPIPVSLVMREGLALEGNNPTLLFGYGAYGIPNDPFLNPQWLAWLERGGIYAVAHVRGGGALGREWHEAGRKSTKPNTWKDGISTAQWLVDNRYTRPGRLGIWGGSAGGILVGRAVIERPDLFAAAVPAVGVMDTLRAERMPGGAANVPEFGTVTRQEDFAALLEMSSYHQLREGLRLPAVMLVHGVNDGRVEVWQSAKFASRLAALESTDRPVLLNLDYEAGHGQGSTREQSRRQMADIWSFMLWHFGDPDFQPPGSP